MTDQTTPGTVLNWIDDGHQIRVTLRDGCFIHAVMCPFDGADLTGKPWNDLPACRRAADEYGRPVPPSKECYLGMLAGEFTVEEFFDGDAPEFEVTSPFAVEYRFEGWDGEAVYVRPKQAETGGAR